MQIKNLVGNLETAIRFQQVLETYNRVSNTGIEIMHIIPKKITLLKISNFSYAITTIVDSIESEPSSWEEISVPPHLSLKKRQMALLLL